METIEFLFEGRACTLLSPETPAVGRPWVWRAEFLGAFDYADQALLARGWHVAYCNMSNEYGAPRAIALFHRFHDHMVQQYGLAPRAAMFGFSRGGLYTCNYARTYPQDLCCIYLDAPVLDLFSWPAGLGLGCGAPEEWQDCKSRVIMCETVEALRIYAGHPIAHLDELVATRLPVLLIAGLADTTVPWMENGMRLVEAYRLARAPITVITKPHCDHHPHSLEDPAPIVTFVEEAFSRT